MTQHEYVFVAISIILGLAITRLLHTVAMLIRVHRRVTFHWSTALWGLCVLAYVLQFWWVGWGLRDLESWHFGDFVVLIVGAICVYGAAEMALPVPEGSGNLDFLIHSESLGRLSCLSMLLYFLVGGIATGLEKKTMGEIHQQEWEFYAVTFCLFLVFALPGFIYRHDLRHHIDRAKKRIH